MVARLVRVRPAQVVSLVLDVLEEFLAPLPILLLLLVRKQIVGDKGWVDGCRWISGLVKPPVESVTRALLIIIVASSYFIPGIGIKLQYSAYSVLLKALWFCYVFC